MKDLFVLQLMSILLKISVFVIGIVIGSIVVNDGTAPSSGTCQFSVTTGTFTNQSGCTLTVNGLAMASDAV